MKLHFVTTDSNGFGRQLQQLSQRYSRRYDLIRTGKKLLWIKLVFYSLLFCWSFAGLITAKNPGLFSLVLHYIIMGLSGMLLAFNAAHDAAHSSFTRSRTINRVIYTLTFNLQGFSGYLWRIRHLASHHIFPNVDGCDADIDDNPFLRLSPHQAARWYHRYQHLYATVFYAAYTLHWMLIKDVQYLCKRDLANLKNQRHSFKAILQILGWKGIYFFYTLLLPMLILPCPVLWIVVGFVAMHIVLSVFFVLTLIISHLCEETAFPLADAEGMLPYDFHTHQLAVSMDYHPRSFIANWLLGGFNAHAAHHLFPRLPHTCYPHYTKVIQKLAKEHGYPYHELAIPKAIASHYRYLKQVGCVKDCASTNTNLRSPK